MLGLGAMGRQLAWVFVAGGVGSMLRVWLAATIDARLASRLPYVGTLAVNLAGCFAIGIASAFLGPGPTRTAIVGGLLGGFTTYSAFAQFSVDLLRTGRPGVLALQIAVHIGGGMLCAWIGMMLGRALGGDASS